METFGERLAAWCSKKGISMYRLSQLIGVSEANLSSIKKGKRPPSDEVLKKIASVPELDLTYAKLRAWLLLGQATPEELAYLKQELEKME